MKRIAQELKSNKPDQMITFITCMTSQKKKPISLLIVILILFVKVPVFGQLDPINNQYLSNQALINPAYVGAHNMFMGMLSTRGQWIGIEGAPFTHTLNAHSSITDEMGAGVLVINDNFGINRNIETILSYSYKINWINHSLSFGLQGGYSQQQLDYTLLDLENFDPNLPVGAEDASHINIGTGLFLKHDNYYIGLSIPRMLEPNLAPEGSPEVFYKRHYYLSGGYVFDYIPTIKIKPSILVRAVEGESVDIDLNGQLIIKNSFWVGVSLSGFSAAGFNFQYLEDGARFGYSFELPVNNLASASFGIHELMVSIDLEILKNQKRIPRYF